MRLFELQHQNRSEEPVRPSHFHEGVEEYEQDPQMQYATDAEQLDPTHYGYPHADGEHGADHDPTRPTPVVLVEPPPEMRSFTDWNSATHSVGTEPIQIGDASRRRRRFVVRNMDAANPVFLTRMGSDNNAMSAFQLPAGQREEIFHNAQIWAFATDAAPVTVSYYAENDTDEN